MKVEPYDDILSPSTSSSATLSTSLSPATIANDVSRSLVTSLVNAPAGKSLVTKPDGKPLVVSIGGRLYNIEQVPNENSVTYKLKCLENASSPS